MLTLTSRKRKLFASSGAMFVSAGFALIPLFGHSAPSRQFASANGVAAPISETRIGAGEVRPRTDPFARELPAIGGTTISRAAAPPKKQRSLRVIAIVMGTKPHALLLLEGGNTQIVGVGDPIETTRVAWIVSDGIVLADGRHLKLSERSQD